MSLFPAYLAEGHQESNKESKNISGNLGNQAWLENESFSVISSLRNTDIHKTTDTQDVVTVLPECSKDTHKHEIRKKKKKKQSKTKRKREDRGSIKHKSKKLRKEQDGRNVSSTPVHELKYFEDKSFERNYLLVSALSGSFVPLYRVSRVTLGRSTKRFSRRKQCLRYFLPESWKKINKNKDADAIPEQSAESNLYNELSDVTIFCENTEEKLTELTSFYNKELAQHPENTDLWLKYVHLQDKIMHSHDNHFSSKEKSIRAVAEKKAAILQRALLHNSTSTKLLYERFYVMLEFTAPSLLLKEYSELLQLQPKNSVLWEQYLTLVQSDLSQCTVSSVVDEYNKCIKTLSTQRKEYTNIHEIEINILDKILQLCVFLRQCGLWERLWTLMRLYLQLNVIQSETVESLKKCAEIGQVPGDSTMFSFNSSISEDEVGHLEDEILNSTDSVSESWVKVESLKQDCHWLPWREDLEPEECKDPQRLVFLDDVLDSVNSKVSQHVSFELVTLVLLVLKVPLLPWRNSTYWRHGFHVTWLLDSVEFLLAALYSSQLVDVSGIFPANIDELVVGPQYLRSRLGQEQYLDFVSCVFEHSADHLQEPARTAICVWWLRFERFLLILEKDGRCQLPPSRKKKLKKKVKEFLKKEQNRNNVLFYREYALIEKELGNSDSACKVLLTAILTCNTPVVGVLCDIEKGNLCSLYHTLCDILLTSGEKVIDSRNKTVYLLTKLGLGEQPGILEEVVTSKEISEAKSKFSHITTDNINKPRAYTDEASSFVFPDFLVSWVGCSAWLQYLTDSCWTASKILEDVLQKLEPENKMDEESRLDQSVIRITSQHEALFETYLSILFFHCKLKPGTYGILQDVLHRAMKIYPNNLQFLAIFAKLETNLGLSSSSWWKMMYHFKETDSAVVQLFLMFIARQRKARMESATLENHHLLQKGGPVVYGNSNLNRISAMFRRITKHRAMRRCPLMWRLYLRFAHEVGNDSLCRSLFYQAVEECPWNKAVYLDAVHVVPTELSQIQDLLIEKELRLHVVPEELAILKGEDAEVVNKDTTKT